jgi:hypothetical protein
LVARLVVKHHPEKLGEKMSEIKTGGPAFPFSDVMPGMSLRDYFAAKAIPQLLFGRPVDDFGMCAQHAYAVADAMIKAREAK